jgi:acid phosphatase type 7
MHLAYFHHPLFTSGRHRPGSPKVRPIWEALYAADADVVLNGHDHNYQRFAPQDPEGNADPQRGIREFVVGTGGGKELYDAMEDTLPNSEVHNGDTHGVLKLTLQPDRYEWRFVLMEGATFTDSGSGRCH